MTIEPIPDNCLPPPHVIADVLRGPQVGPDGKITGGTYDGMTPAEVLRQRDEYESGHCPGLLEDLLVSLRKSK